MNTDKCYFPARHRQSAYTMSQVIPLQGPKAEALDEANSEWKDFFSDEEEKEKETVQKDKGEGSPKDKPERELAQDSSRGLSDHDHDNYPSNSEYPEGDECGRSRKKHRKMSKSRKGKKSSTHHLHETRPPPLNLYPNTTKDQVHAASSRSRHNQDSMSDQGEMRSRGRKLQRRSPMKRYPSLDQAVEQAGRDRLEQKYVELTALLTRPLTDTRGGSGRASRHTEHPQLARARADRWQNRVEGWGDGAVQEEEETGEESKAYATIRELQTGGKRVQLHISYDRQRPSTASAHKPAQNNLKVTSKPPIPRRHRKGSVESSPTSSSGASEIKKADHNGDYSSEGESSRSRDSPKRVYLPSDMHLKNSDNPELLDWLKRKNVEYRCTKKAERAKRREERNEKMLANELKIARREKSAEKVQKWMEAKRKEAARHEREGRRSRKQDKARQEAARRATSSTGGVVKFQTVDPPPSALRPHSAPSSKPQNYIPVKRPESAADTAAKLDGTAPKPPDTKFVYKRPVSGRVRLIKLQNKWNSDARKADQKRAEELTADEKEKRARTSYDSWLIAKRRNDLEKRKEAKLQQEMSKSDPELRDIIPQMARHRIEKIKNGKKRIDTGRSDIDGHSNAQFDGVDFGYDDEEATTVTEEGSGERDGSSVPKPSSYHLSTEGTSASLVELSTRARPVTAKTHMPIPQSVFSPRQRHSPAKPRPQSARTSGRVRAVMDADLSQEPNPFKLPFPEELGVPDHVKRVQKQIFSKGLTASQQSSKSERPEPQGCASTESTCPRGLEGACAEHSGAEGDSGRLKSGLHTSMQLLQEIEAAAVQCEQDAVLNGACSAFKRFPDEFTSCDVEEESVEEAIPEFAGRGQNEDDWTGQESTESKIDNREEASNADSSLPTKPQTDDEHSKREDGHNADDSKVSFEECTQEVETCEPIPVSADGSEGISTLESYILIDSTSEMTQRQGGESLEADESQYRSAEDSTQDADKEEADDRDGEDMPRKSSSKHVSFSEDLTSVFERGSTEMSSSFDDEKCDDVEVEEKYMTLDEAPDPTEA